MKGRPLARHPHGRAAVPHQPVRHRTLLLPRLRALPLLHRRRAGPPQEPRHPEARVRPQPPRRGHPHQRLPLGGGSRHSSPQGARRRRPRHRRAAHAPAVPRTDAPLPAPRAGGALPLPADPRAAAAVLRALRHRPQARRPQRQPSRSRGNPRQRGRRPTPARDRREARRRPEADTSRANSPLRPGIAGRPRRGGDHVRWRRSRPRGRLARQAAGTGGVRPCRLPAAPGALPAPRPRAHPLRRARRRPLAPVFALRVVRVLRPLPRRDARAPTTCRAWNSSPPTASAT